MRALISFAIEHNYSDFARQLHGHYLEKNLQGIDLVLKVLFYQLMDQDFEVGLKSLRTLKKIFSQLQLQSLPHLKSILLHPLALQYLQQGLNLEDSTVNLRFMELLIYFTNQDADVQQKYKEEGFLAKAVSFYDTDDILVKLNAIEILSYMGNSKWNSEFLKQSQFMAQILKDASSSENDFYVRKYQAILYCKLIGWRTIELTENIQKQLLPLAQAWLCSQSNEEKEAGLELVQYLSRIGEVCRLG